MTDDNSEMLGDVSHTNPYTGESFGETQTYRRGRVVAVDGGSRSEQAGGADGGSRSEQAGEADGGSRSEQAGGADGGRGEASGETADADGRGDLKRVDHTPPRDAPSANGAFDRDDDANDDSRGDREDVSG